MFTEKILNGKQLAQTLRQEQKEKIKKLNEQNIFPGLATVLVGEDPASKIYVNNKIKCCEEVGIYNEHYNLSTDISEEKLLQLINNLNNNNKISGILVQLPLPSHLNQEKITSSISPQKDADCFHPLNLGRMFIEKNWQEIKNKKLILPCTPLGIMEILERNKIEIAKKNVVVVGRSNIVGKPLSFLLLSANATVTICHSQTKNLKEVTFAADILVAAIGKANFISGDMVKENTIVIDVGMNRNEKGLCGDVNFEEVAPKVSFITPVPGGIGPLTIAMLLENTIKLALS